MPINSITNQRLNKYLIASGFNHERAIKLYGWGIQLNEAFYPLLSAAEISFRNIVASQIIRVYGENWWTDPVFLSSIGKGSRTILAVTVPMKRKGAVTSDKVIAAVTFGFWVKTLLPAHKNTLWNDFPAAFPCLPENITYEELGAQAERILEFRNRVFHHEPIIQRNLSNDASELLKFIGWMNTNKAHWIKPYSRVMQVMRSKPK